MDKRPNIVLLVLDSVRADHCSTYDYKRETTPNLSKIAREGILFDNVYSTGSWTVPAHGSLFSGQLPGQHGTHAKNKYFSVSSQNTLAGKLEKKGYQSVGFSANPWITEEFGFDSGFRNLEKVLPEILRFPDAGNPRDVLDGGGKTTQVSSVLKWALSKNTIKRLVNTIELKRSTWSYTDAKKLNNELINWLEKYDRNSPFFLFANYMDAHEPYLLDEEHGHFVEEHSDDNLEINWNIESLNMPPKVKQQSIVNAYDSSIKYLDDHIGQLINDIDSMGELDNTFVIILGDHGQCLGEHQYWGHGTFLYDELLHIPLLIRPPDHIDIPPINAARHMSLVDVHHLSMSMANRELTLRSEKYDQLDIKNPIPAESFGKHQSGGVESKKYSENGYLKLYFDGGFTLHDLDSDELIIKMNKSGKDENVTESDVREMEKKIFSQRNEKGDQKKNGNMNKETKKQLENLGYL